MTKLGASFMRPEHRVVGLALRQMDKAMLTRCRASFGGGTAAVLALGEYRVSQAIDFLCADPDGYANLRIAVQREGSRALLKGPHEAVREFRADRYGIRGMVAIDGHPVKIEIVREDRILLDPPTNSIATVPVLTQVDQIAEKLMANVDRGMDASFHHRDALDLGMLINANKGIPAASLDKTKRCYPDLGEHTVKAAAFLAETSKLAACATALGMERRAATLSTQALIHACRETWLTEASRHLPKPVRPDLDNERSR